MEPFNRTMRFLVDLVMAPLQRLSPSGSLLVLSVLMGLLFLLVFRLTSDQPAIRHLRNQMAAHLLEFRLFRDSLSIQWSALAGILLCNLKYLKCTGRPLLLMLVPLGLVLVHLNEWYGYQPLKPEQTTLVALKLAGEGIDLSSVRLEPGGGVALVGKPLRIPRTQEINWSIRPERQGKALLTFLFHQQQVQKGLMVSDDGLVRVSRVTPAQRFWDVLRHPGAAPLPKDSFATSISVEYPARTVSLLGWELHWIVYFLIFSSLSALVFKRFLGVQL